MIKAGLSFALLFTVILIATYFGHEQVNAAKSLSTINPIWYYYLLNYGFGLITVLALIRLSATKSELLGFVFMGASMVKFAWFFIFFFGDIQDNPSMKKQEFISFFIPYAMSLAVEVTFLIRYLNKQDSLSDN